MVDPQDLPKTTISTKNLDILTPDPYLRHKFNKNGPLVRIEDIHFCPFEDILGVGHSNGFSSLIVPGIIVIVFFRFW